MKILPITIYQLLWKWEMQRRGKHAYLKVTLIRFTATDVSGVVTLSGQANKRGAALPS
jgi:hypothetical protein